VTDVHSIQNLTVETVSKTHPLQKLRAKPKQFPNPKGIKPQWDTEIKAAPKDKSSPKPPYGYGYFAEPYDYKNQPVKKDISNAPLADDYSSNPH